MSTAHILLVEDNEGDILLTMEAFEEQGSSHKISVVRNGMEALNFLFNRAGYHDAEKPDLILLDINMPILNGHEVLAQIKNDPILKMIPVIVLTTSSNPKDIQLAYSGHANSYVNKPLELDDFHEAIYKIEQFWLGLAAYVN